MTHHNDIGITTQDARGVVKRLSFRNSGTLKPRCLSNMATQKVERATEADACAGGGLKEHRTQNGAIKHRRLALSPRIGAHAVGHLKNAINIGTLELIDPQDVMTGKFHSASISLRIGLRAWDLSLNRSGA
ncbi:MAG: Uncharacterised protein [Halieaceae bacterium]|nr:MAG: Uncharacterised protein [Halieaceae bacterium]